MDTPWLSVAIWQALHKHGRLAQCDLPALCQVRDAVPDKASVSRAMKLLRQQGCVIIIERQWRSLVYEATSTRPQIKTGNMPGSRVGLAIGSALTSIEARTACGVVPSRIALERCWPHVKQH